MHEISYVLYVTNYFMYCMVRTITDTHLKKTTVDGDALFEYSTVEVQK
jgi:hypothetical protein